MFVTYYIIGILEEIIWRDDYNTKKLEQNIIIALDRWSL